MCQLEQTIYASVHLQIDLIAIIVLHSKYIEVLVLLFLYLASLKGICDT